MSKYFKPDSELGYVEDSAEISYLKFNNLRHTILGCMLGDFDEQGCYYVSPQIVEELIEMPKYLVETIDNIEVCKSALKLDKHISFLVTFEQDRAILSLIEKISFEANLTINSGTYSNINEYVLDVVQTSGLINKNAIYARWNIKPFDGATIDVFNCDSSILEKYFNIVNKFKIRLKENTAMLNHEAELEEVEAEYFNEMLSVLKHYPKLEKAVMQQLKVTMEEKKDFIKVDKPNFAKTVNEILDNAIEENKSVLTVEEKQEFQAEVHNIKNDTVIKRDSILPVISTIAEEEKDIELKNDLAEDKKKSSETSEVEEIEVKDIPVDAEKQTDKTQIDETVAQNNTSTNVQHVPGVAVVRTSIVVKENLEAVAQEQVDAQRTAYKMAETRTQVKQPEQETVLTPLEKMAAALTGFGVGLATVGAVGVVGAAAAVAVAEVASEVVKAVDGDKKAPETPKVETKPTEKGNATAQTTVSTPKSQTHTSALTPKTNDGAESQDNGIEKSGVVTQSSYLSGFDVDFTTPSRRKPSMVAAARVRREHEADMVAPRAAGDDALAAAARERDARAFVRTNGEQLIVGKNIKVGTNVQVGRRVAVDSLRIKNTDGVTNNLG